MPTHYSGTRQRVLALDTFIKLTRATDSVLARLASHHTHTDLTASQFGVMEAIYHLGPMCQSELAGKLLKSGGNITLVIDNLEKLDLVHRQRDPEDRRMIIVSLTEAGQQKISEIFPGHVDAVVEEMSVLTSSEQEALSALCRKLGKNLQS